MKEIPRTWLALWRKKLEMILETSVNSATARANSNNLHPYNNHGPA